MSDGAVILSKNIVLTDQSDSEATTKHLSPTKGKEMQHSPSKSTFVTSSMIHHKKIDYDDEKYDMDDILAYNEKIKGIVDQLDQKVKVLLGENQNNFLIAYKDQMAVIQKELRGLRAKIEEETSKRKTNEIISILEQERDWFKSEAIRLDNTCKEQNRVILELKMKLKFATDDKNFFEKNVLVAKRENRSLMEELEKFEVTGINRTELPAINTNKRRSHTLSNKKGRKLSPINNKGDQSYAKAQAQAFEIFDKIAEQDITNDTGNGNDSSAHQPYFTNAEERLLELNRQLKAELEREKKTTRQLTQEKAQILMKRIQLETILVESINEVKRDILKRKNSKNTKNPELLQSIDASNFTGIDKRNLIESFLSNESVMDQLYNLVFNNPSANPNQTNLNPTASINLSKMTKSPSNKFNPLHSVKSEPKTKFSFDYGFQNINVNNMTVSPKEMSNLTVTEKARQLKNSDFKPGTGLVRRSINELKM